MRLKRINEEIVRLTKEIEEIPLKKRVSLGGRGIALLSKRHKLMCERDSLLS